jgi:hypothetical protein
MAASLVTGSTAFPPLRLPRRAPLLLAVAFAAFAGAGCSTDPYKPPPELTDEQVCLKHFENDPVERDRCHLTGEQRQGRPQDLDPHQLPVRTGDPSG